MYLEFYNEKSYYGEVIFSVSVYALIYLAWVISSCGHVEHVVRKCCICVLGKLAGLKCVLCKLSGPKWIGWPRPLGAHSKHCSTNRQSGTVWRFFVATSPATSTEIGAREVVGNNMLLASYIYSIVHFFPQRRLTTTTYEGAPVRKRDTAATVWSADGDRGARVLRRRPQQAGGHECFDAVHSSCLQEANQVHAVAICQELICVGQAAFLYMHDSYLLTSHVSIYLQNKSKKLRTWLWICVHLNLKKLWTR